MMSPRLSIRWSGGLAALALLAAACADRPPPLDPDVAPPLAAAGGPHVVHVAPPTGDVATDRLSILAALEEVQPGGTVQFAPGTYIIGFNDGAWGYIPVTVPRVTLQGHPDGTRLRGCDLEPQDILDGGCVGFEMSGGRQTLRNIHFKDMSVAVTLGEDIFFGGSTSRTGGYRVEGNSFRDIATGVQVFGQWSQPAVIRSNTFINLFSAVDVWGRTAHIMDNDISAPDWERIPVWFGAIYGISLLTLETQNISTGPCEHNQIAGNRIDGFTDALNVWVLGIGAPCRHNVVRDNLVVNSREYTPGFGTGPVFLYNGSANAGFLSDNLIQSNRVHGSFGNGVVLFNGERNRVVNNTITDIQKTFPFQGWLGESNGSGVWTSPGGGYNKILSNDFANVEAEEVVLESDHNHVATRSASDVVRDLGVGNRITGPGSVVTAAAPAGASAGAAPTATERAEAALMLRDRLGVRGRALQP
jgi:parallel beta-helix repeat protein